MSRTCKLVLWLKLLFYAFLKVILIFNLNTEFFLSLSVPPKMATTFKLKKIERITDSIDYLRIYNICREQVPRWFREVSRYILFLNFWSLCVQAAGWVQGRHSYPTLLCLVTLFFMPIIFPS